MECHYSTAEPWKFINPKSDLGSFAMSYAFALVLWNWKQGRERWELLAANTNEIEEKNSSGINFEEGFILGVYFLFYRSQLRVLQIRHYVVDSVPVVLSLSLLILIKLASHQVRKLSFY